MPATNLAPSNIQKKRALAFPFQRGPVNFPALSADEKRVFDSIHSLLLTGKGERVMRPRYGVDVHQYVFDTITPLMQARISADVTGQIQLYEPRAKVISVIPSLLKNETGMETTLVIDVLYRVGNQPVQQQVPVPLTSKGT